MKLFRAVVLTIAAVSVSACAGPQMPSRNATLQSQNTPTALAQPQQAQQALPQLGDVSVAAVTVEVPRTLSVSEKNSYLPKADIVWRGDLMGDRHEQVKAIFEQSAQKVTEELTGARQVRLHIQVTRFHGLTEKARYSTGGVHNMNFYLAIYDAKTGEELRPARHIVTNLDAFGGDAAVAADQRGETQKLRVTQYLANALRDELTKPGGFVDTNTGVFVAMNRQ